MINVYSISEIIEASDKILRSPIKDEGNLPLEGKIKIKKKETDVLINKPLILKNIEKKKDIPVDLEKIIVEVEKSQSKENVIENNLPKHEKTFNAAESYNTMIDKFELKKHEDKIALNMVNKMIAEIIIYLHSI